MNKIKMIITDLDNTLLNDKKKISPYTLEMIEACRARGIKFIPATARPLRKLVSMEIIDLFPYDALISCNGSRIYLDDEVIYRRGISKPELDAFLPSLLEHYGDSRISIEMNNIMHVNHQVLEVDPTEDSFLISDLKNLPDDTVDRIILEAPLEDEVTRIEAILPDYLYTHAVSDAPICRILHKDVSKAYAIDHLAKLWNISANEIVCFGDDANDLEMFEYCAFAIAMENAISDVKTAATGHTKNNNEDGVAFWLEENILNL